MYFDPSFIDICCKDLIKMHSRHLKILLSFVGCSMWMLEYILMSAIFQALGKIPELGDWVTLRG